MSAGNLFLTRKKAFDLREVTVNAATYTVKVGTTANDFIVDRVVHVNVAPCTITLPNGTYEGQRVLVNCVDADIAGTIAVEPEIPEAASDMAFTVVGNYCSYEWVNATAGWIALASWEGV